MELPESLQIKKTRAEVKKEIKIETVEVSEAAALDLDLDDDLEAEMARRQKARSTDRTNMIAKPATTPKKAEEIEEEARQAERAAETSQMPDSVGAWERAVIASPNNSEVWLRYVAYHITLGEIERARVVLDRALKTINFREGSEKLNVWKARLNLEAMYGEEEALMEQFNEAKRCNDERKIYEAMIDQQITRESYPMAMRLLKDAVKKFSNDFKLWSLLGKCQMLQGEQEKARVTMERALQANKAKDHANIVQKFARLEFEYGDAEKGKTIFEQTLKLYAKRGDIWSVYADLLMKYEGLDQAINVLERGLSEITKKHGRNHLIKRIVYMEERRGDAEKAQEWRNKLD